MELFPTSARERAVDREVAKLELRKAVQRAMEEQRRAGRTRGEPGPSTGRARR